MKWGRSFENRSTQLPLNFLFLGDIPSASQHNSRHQPSVILLTHLAGPAIAVEAGGVCVCAVPCPFGRGSGGAEAGEAKAGQVEHGAVALAAGEEAAMGAILNQKLLDEFRADLIG